VVGLEHVNSVDSAGIGALIEIQRKTKAKGGRLTLAHLGPKLKQALEMAGFCQYLKPLRRKAMLLAVFERPL